MTGERNGVSARLKLCVFLVFREPWSKRPASASRSAVIDRMRPKLTCETPALVLGENVPSCPDRNTRNALSAVPIVEDYVHTVVGQRVEEVFLMVDHHVSRTQGQRQFDVRPCGSCDNRIGTENRLRELHM